MTLYIPKLCHYSAQTQFRSIWPKANPIKTTLIQYLQSLPSISQNCTRTGKHGRRGKLFTTNKVKVMSYNSHRRARALNQDN